MRSSRKQPERPTFFLDRGLGKHHVAAALRKAGQDVTLMAEVYPHDGQRVGDDEWIRDVSDRGWIALTKDTSIIRDHTVALEHSDLRLFALPNANLTGEQMGERFVRNLNRILQRARHAGPFVDVVHPDHLERRWPLRL